MGVVGERLRDLRKQAGLTQVELGSRLGLTGATISGYETGEHHFIADEVPRFAEALRVSPCDFFPPTEALNPPAPFRIASEDETLERLEGSLAAIRHDERRRIIRLIEQMDGLDDSA